MIYYTVIEAEAGVLGVVGAPQTALAEGGKLQRTAKVPLSGNRALKHRYLALCQLVTALSAPKLRRA